MPTIKDIAKAADVSIATVSIVLNGKGKERKISHDTQQRILEIAHNLNYVPNQSAKKLRVAQSDSYSVAFYWATDFRINYLARITLGLQREIMRQNNPVHLTVVPYKVDELHKQLETEQNKFFNGIIIANMSDKDMDYLNRTTFTCPVVLFNRISDKYGCVTMDNYQIGRNVGQHFLEKSLFHTGVLTHDTSFPIMRMWMNGFLDVFAEAGHPISDDNIILCDTSSASAVTVCEELYRTGRMPQALFCESDVLAHGVLFACHKLGIAIPQDLEVFTIGITMPEINDFSIPSLSRVDIPMGQIGEACMRLITDLIEQKTTVPATIYIDGRKIIGQSSPEA
ncbi:LacI family DNA-binding transcriptional regulator [Colibacter massiliensis]|uniref:LacI family DNA-binding transcriptional regulator n=1 Tax=Colibacter massiliensis TaxID=1852379 RepID=UPI003F8FB0E3